MFRLVVLCLISMTMGCAYVTEQEYDDYLDGKGDGWPLDEDCDDDNAGVYPFAPDLRGDTCDADCGEEPDADGDDWPDAADCEPENPHVYPWADEGTAEFDGVDWDCDGLDSTRTDPPDNTDPDFPDEPKLNPCVSSGGY